MSPETKSLASDAYWEGMNKDWNLAAPPSHDVIRCWLEGHLPTCTGTALEIGCYPGRYLAVLGRMGYEVSGIDLAEGTDTRMRDWLKSEGIRTGQIVRADFLQHPFGGTFDLVCSFGFLEHFDDWKTILARHASLVAPQGRLALTTPNFRGPILHPLRRWLDADNLAKHNVASMAPDEWAAELRRQGFEIIYAGYIGRFEFFASRQRRGFFKRALVRLIEYAAPLVRKLSFGGRTLAPYCAILAKRRDPA